MIRHYNRCCHDENLPKRFAWNYQPMDKEYGEEEEEEEEESIIDAAEKFKESQSRPQHSDTFQSLVPRQQRSLTRAAAVAAVVFGTWSSTATLPVNFAPPLAHSAPPIAVIAEQLGYFPVINKQGDMVYVPKRVQRTSSEQAIQLAQKLRESGAVIYTAYWCPHCARQKELLGKEAWALIRNVECAPQGYNTQPTLCLAKRVDGYPTWILGNDQRLSGERPLSELAKAVGWQDNFDESLEQNVPPPLGSGVCQ